jgi:hypothetical protein
MPAQYSGQEPDPGLLPGSGQPPGPGLLPGSGSAGTGRPEQPSACGGPAELGPGGVLTVDLSDLQSVLDAAREGDEAAGDPLGADAGRRRSWRARRPRRWRRARALAAGQHASCRGR